MADIALTALYASVVEDEEEGFLFIGFAEGEDEDEGYVLFRQPLSGGAVWFEVNDEAFGADEALAEVRRDEQGLLISIAPQKLGSFGWASTVRVVIGPGCEDADEGLAALKAMLGGIWVE